MPANVRTDKDHKEDVQLWNFTCLRRKLNASDCCALNVLKLSAACESDRCALSPVLPHYQYDYEIKSLTDCSQMSSVDFNWHYNSSRNCSLRCGCQDPGPAVLVHPLQCIFRALGHGLYMALTCWKCNLAIRNGHSRVSDTGDRKLVPSVAETHLSFTVSRKSRRVGVLHQRNDDGRGRGVTPRKPLHNCSVRHILHISTLWPKIHRPLGLRIEAMVTRLRLANIRPETRTQNPLHRKPSNNQLRPLPLSKARVECDAKLSEYFVYSQECSSQHPPQIVRWRHALSRNVRYFCLLDCFRLRAKKTGDSRENPPTSGIDRYDFHVQNCGTDPAGNRTLFAWVGGEWSNHYTPAVPTRIPHQLKFVVNLLKLMVPNAMSRKQVWLRCTAFAKDRTGVQDEQRSSWPSKSTTDENVRRIGGLVQDDRRIRFGDITKELNI
ncbi:hypothetical protein PR048_017867 [Dryococelus australis]|uniref:Uncharacterized protein n=1 Tax=Dryococelus australis TaxID=614101 RepID=A0ABQ9HAP4_9NEOP|nr:hypothetical protein PR048_017867 [Dryococelus australis]